MRRKMKRKMNGTNTRWVFTFRCTALVFPSGFVATGNEYMSGVPFVFLENNNPKGNPHKRHPYVLHSARRHRVRRVGSPYQIKCAFGCIRPAAVGLVCRVHREISPGQHHLLDAPGAGKPHVTAAQREF